ncbi:hypothetical protein KC207_03215 [Phycicoccus sp. BSK3Z-2]|uniref:Uncharacterized protein n=1 Tax=Phycicoccus avicenniae TaxID=2828860 RepID=A0A941D9F9_9MICO|nr:hypothetical protein [Phycicoccus avicenniae]MBR7742302.1 hypothetical protein [Phycicoccus avicenniae]
MLPWWGWLLLWSVLVLGGGVVVFLRLRSLWRSVRALSAEVSRAGRVVAELEAALERSPAVHPPDTAVAQAPRTLLRQYRSERARQRADRSARRAARMPAWARVD